MIRMEIALFLVLLFVACVYFSAGRRQTMLHKTFAAILIVVMLHLVFDALTVYTVNRLNTIPWVINDTLHRCFIGTMMLAMYLFYQYIAILVEEETGSPRRMDLAARIYLIAAEAAILFTSIDYAKTPHGNYAIGIPATCCYASVTFYLLLCSGLMIWNWKRIEKRKKAAIGAALLIEFTVCILQGLHATWLISGMGLALMTMSFYLTLENPDKLQAELTEQKMSMLYLKSQISPHFLYNTLDSIRIQAELGGDKKVAKLLMQLVDFFRHSVKVNEPMVSLDDELELLDVYMELMCYRYPSLHYECSADPELMEAQVPNFILQPIVENSLLHGLKNKGYCGSVEVRAVKKEKGVMEIQVIDTGSGFEPEKKEQIDQMLRNYSKYAPKLEGNRIGMLNVQKRIKLLCGREFGLSYTENENGGVTAHLLLPITEDER